MFLGITWGELGILADGELLLAQAADPQWGLPLLQRLVPR